MFKLAILFFLMYLLFSQIVLQKPYLLGLTLLLFNLFIIFEYRISFGNKLLFIFLTSGPIH